MIARNLGIVGDTDTVLLGDDDTAGRFCLIDMLVPPGGGPGSHRHDVEEAFTVLEDKIALTFRRETSVLRAGETANIPANAPHALRTESRAPARFLCLCSPVGQEEFFAGFGQPVASRIEPPPPLDATAMEAFQAKPVELSLNYRSGMLGP